MLLCAEFMLDRCHGGYKIINIATGKDDKIAGIFEPHCMGFISHTIKLTAPWIA